MLNKNRNVFWIGIFGMMLAAACTTPRKLIIPAKPTGHWEFQDEDRIWDDMPNRPPVSHPPKKSLTNKAKAIPRQKHRFSGWIELTDPPWYSCILCGKEVFAGSLIPKAYADMKYPMHFINAKGETSAIIFYQNGYHRFCDSIAKIPQNIDSLFNVRWNEIDTICNSPRPKQPAKKKGGIK